MGKGGSTGTPLWWGGLGDGHLPDGGPSLVGKLGLLLLARGSKGPPLVRLTIEL